MRILAFISLIALLPLAAIAPMPRGRDAQACDIGVEPLEAVIQRASPIVLARAVSIGGAANPLPEVTPLPPRIAGPSVFPTRTPTDLTGIGGIFEVARVLAGEAQSPLAVDAAIRQSVERTVRQSEAAPSDQIPPCEPGLGVSRYTQGADYYLFLGDYSPLGTISFRADGDDVVLSGSPNTLDDRQLIVSAATYDRFFSAYPAERFEDGSAFIRAPRISARDFESAVTYLLNPPPITPPNTGTAGLRARSDGWGGHLAGMFTTTCGIGPEPFEQAISDAERIVLATALTVGSSGFDTLTPESTVLPDADLTGVGGTFRVERVYKGSAAEVIEVDMVQRRLAEAALRNVLAHPETSPPCGLAAGAARYGQRDRYLLLLDEERDLGAMALRVTTNARGVEVIDGRYGSGVWMMPATFRRLLPDLPQPADAYPVNTGNYTKVEIDLYAMEGLIGEILGRIYPPDTGTAGLLPRAADRKLTTEN